MEALYDPKKGITRLIRAIESLDQEFEPLRKELRGMRRRSQELADELAKATPATDSRALQEKTTGKLIAQLDQVLPPLVLCANGR
jgi:uncharacterized coiled-coil DUF342 family protein